jgi:hypothetical protein
MFLQDVGIEPNDYMAQQSRRPSILTSQWKYQFLEVK